jgi:hypothetical protein
LHYAKQARRIELDQERIAFFIMQAIDSGFTEQNFERAKIWILYGDWRFRGNDPTLQWDDLFPSDDQVREAHSRTKSSLLLIPAKTMQDELLNAYRTGYDEGKREGMTRMTPEQFDQLRESLERWTTK